MKKKSILLCVHTVLSPEQRLICNPIVDCKPKKTYKSSGTPGPQPHPLVVGIRWKNLPLSKKWNPMCHLSSAYPLTFAPIVTLPRGRVSATLWVTYAKQQSCSCLAFEKISFSFQSGMSHTFPPHLHALTFNFLNLFMKILTFLSDRTCGFINPPSVTACRTILV